MRGRYWLIIFRTGRYRSKSYQRVWSTRYRSISTDRLSILRAKFLQKYYKVSCMQMRLSTPQWSIAREWILWLVSCTWSTRMKRDRSLSWSTWLSGTPWVTYSIRTPSSCAKNSTSSTESSPSVCQILTVFFVLTIFVFLRRKRILMLVCLRQRFLSRFLHRYSSRSSRLSGCGSCKESGTTSWL